MTAPLMPKATAVWLVENTALTFRQIATFCELHELEVQAIADGDVAYNIIGISPIANGQLSPDEIKRCEDDASANLVASIVERNVKETNAKNKKVLSPSQRNDKPAAILWVVRNCPEIADSQICKLIGTTKPTIMSIRNGTRANMANLRAKNPVAIGLCSEKDLDKAITVAKEKAAKALAPKKKAAKKKPVKKAAPKKAATKKTAAKKTAKKVAKKPAAKKKTTKKTAK
ncbi:MAG: cell cycle transcriptional regulator TrcR [Alphaproteobacteria bacterium]|nr:cell cycle transcriptional regulator TrcR [Alphaproteobacteria bacterium]